MQRLISSIAGMSTIFAIICVAALLQPVLSSVPFYVTQQQEAETSDQIRAIIKALKAPFDEKTRIATYRAAKNETVDLGIFRKCSFDFAEFENVRDKIRILGLTYKIEGGPKVQKSFEEKGSVSYSISNLKSAMNGYCKTGLVIGKQAYTGTAIFSLVLTCTRRGDGFVTPREEECKATKCHVHLDNFGAELNSDIFQRVATTPFCKRLESGVVHALNENNKALTTRDSSNIQDVSQLNQCLSSTKTARFSSKVLEHMAAEAKIAKNSSTTSLHTVPTEGSEWVTLESNCFTGSVKAFVELECHLTNRGKQVHPRHMCKRPGLKTDNGHLTVEAGSVCQVRIDTSQTEAVKSLNYISPVYLLNYVATKTLCSKLLESTVKELNAIEHAYAQLEQCFAKIKSRDLLPEQVAKKLMNDNYRKKPLGAPYVLHEVELFYPTVKTDCFTGKMGVVNLNLNCMDNKDDFSVSTNESCTVQGPGEENRHSCRIHSVEANKGTFSDAAMGKLPLIRSKKEELINAIAQSALCPKFIEAAVNIRKARKQA